MQTRLYPTTIALMLALAGCVPGAAEYSRSEAPNQLEVDGARSEIQLAFAAGSDRLSQREAGRLDRLVSSGAILPADRVAVAASGSPGLAQRRAAAVAGELLRYGIVAQTRALDGMPSNRVIVEVGRYTVTLPACPNWSKSPATDFSNAPSSNFGCANASNLGLMAAKSRRPRQRPPPRLRRRDARGECRRPLSAGQGQAAGGGRARPDPVRRRQRGRRAYACRRPIVKAARASATADLDRDGVIAVLQDQGTSDRLQGVIRELQLDDELTVTDTLDAALRRIRGGRRPAC